MSDLAERKRAVRARIAARREQLAADLLDVKAAMSPLAALRSAAVRTLPVLRSVASMASAVSPGRRGVGGSWSKWLRIGLGASLLVPLMRSLFPNAEDD